MSRDFFRMPSTTEMDLDSAFFIVDEEHKRVATITSIKRLGQKELFWGIMA